MSWGNVHIDRLACQHLLRDRPSLFRCVACSTEISSRVSQPDHHLCALQFLFSLSVAEIDATDARRAAGAAIVA